MGISTAVVSSPRVSDLCISSIAMSSPRVSDLGISFVDVYCPRASDLCINTTAVDCLWLGDPGIHSFVRTPRLNNLGIYFLAFKVLTSEIWASYAKLLPAAAPLYLFTCLLRPLCRAIFKPSFATT